MSRIFELREDPEWYVLRTTDVFHSFDSVQPEIEWLTALYGDYTYKHRDIIVFGGNKAYASIMVPEHDALDDPDFTFGFKDSRDAVTFRLTFS